MNLNKSNLRGKFHSHTTVVCNDIEALKAIARELKYSITVIDLERDTRSQRDVMLTKHFHTERNNMSMSSVHNITRSLQSDCVTLRERGFDVVRVKLEHESLPTLQPSSENYREIHIKCKMVDTERDDIIRRIAEIDNTVVPSSNVFAKHDDGTVTQFLNKRCYSGTIDSIEESIATLRASIETMCSVLEVKSETIVYDTNQKHDKWWA